MQISLQRSHSAPGFLQPQYRQTQEESDGIDAAAVQFVASLISARTKQLKKLDYQAQARRRTRAKKDAFDLIAAIAGRVIEALDLQERHDRATKLTNALQEKIETRAQRLKVDFFLGDPHTTCQGGGQQCCGGGHHEHILRGNWIKSQVQRCCPASHEKLSSAPNGSD